MTQKVAGPSSDQTRIRVYAGPRGVFACLNYNTDQPFKAVQQNVRKMIASLCYPVLIHTELITIDSRGLNQDITSLTITSPSLHHHFFCLFVYLSFVDGLVIHQTYPNNLEDS